MYKYLEDQRFPKTHVQSRIYVPVLKVWQTIAPFKIAFLVWPGLQERNLIREKFQERDIIWHPDARFVLSMVSPITISSIHVLSRESFGFSFFGRDGSTNSQVDSIWETTHKLRSPNLTRAGLIELRVIVHAIMWIIWQERNNRIFIKEKFCSAEENWYRLVQS